MNGLPAILGGDPIFPQAVPISSSTLPEYAAVEEKYKDIFDSGMITNFKYVREYEQGMAQYLGVAEAVAVSSCSAGLMLSLKCSDLQGEVILPSFTFSMTGHALAWNGLQPVYVDIDPETCLIDPEEVEKAITPNTSAILAVHTWGNPCLADRLEDIANQRGLTLLFDAAQATGSRYMEKPVGGFGRAEIFSCSPTKVVTSGEGGIIATNGVDLAQKLRVARNYGDDGSYDCEFEGFNARMSEFNAVLGLASLEMADQNIARRHQLFNILQTRLAKLPGIRFPTTTPSGIHNGVYFSIIIDSADFGLTRDQLYQSLKTDGVDTRRYYLPPLHRQKVNAQYTSMYEGKLPHTDALSETSLTLPMFSHMTDHEAAGVCQAIERLHENSDQVRIKCAELAAKG